MGNLTNFGKKLRMLRLEKEVMLKTLASELDIPSSYLSAIETGNKPVNARLINKIVLALDLTKNESNELTKLASELKNDVTIKPSNSYETELALMFARRMDNNSLDLESLRGFLDQSFESGE